MFVALLLGWLLGIDPLSRIQLDLSSGARGLAATAPPLLLLILPRGWLPSPVAHFFDTVEQLLGPLFWHWNWRHMLAVSVCAGVGEEMLFRGVVQPVLVSWLGIVAGVGLANLLFGVVHFISLAMRSMPP